MVKAGQISMYGPDRVVATDLSYKRCDKWVEVFCSSRGFVDRAEQIRSALERAL